MFLLRIIAGMMIKINVFKGGHHWSAVIHCLWAAVCALPYLPCLQTPGFKLTYTPITLVLGDKYQYKTHLYDPEICSSCWYFRTNKKKISGLIFARKSRDIGEAIWFERLAWNSVCEPLCVPGLSRQKQSRTYLPDVGSTPPCEYYLGSSKRAIGSLIFLETTQAWVETGSERQYFFSRKYKKEAILYWGARDSMILGIHLVWPYGLVSSAQV